MDKEIRLQIEGMHCAACVRRVTTALARTPGVHVESVEVGSAAVRLDSGVDPQTAATAVDQIGFQATVTPEV